MVVQNTPGGAVKIVTGGQTQVATAGVAQTSAGAFSPPSGTGFIHITAGAMDGAARNPTASEVPGFGGVTVSGIPTSGQVPIASSGVAAAWGTLTVGASGVTGGTAGQVFITNSTPQSAWTSLVSVELTHGRFTSGGSGSDFKTVIGPVVGSETTAAGLWLIGNATSPSGSNTALSSDGVSTYVNAPGGGNICYYSGGAALISVWNTVSISLNVDPIVWYDGRTPAIAQNTAGSDHATANMTITTQAPYPIAATNLTAGDLIVNVPASVGAGTKRGGLVVEYNGTVCTRLGGFSNGTYGALWCMDGGTPTSTNYTFLGRTNETYFGVPTAGTMYFGFANTHFPLIMTQSSVAIGDFNQSIVTFDAMTAAAVMHFTETASSASIIYDPRTSDAVAHDLKLTTQGPWASATTNKSPGNFVVQTPLPITGAGFYGGMVWNRGDGTPGWRLGYYGGPDLTYTGMWFEDGGTPSSTGYAFLGTATRTDLNAATNLNLCIGSAYQLVITGTTSMNMIANANINNLTFGITARTSDVATGALTIQAPYAYTSATGTNRKPGDLILDVGPATNSGTTDAYVIGSRNGSNMWRLGPLVGSVTTWYALYPAGVTANANNWNLTADIAGTTLGLSASTNVNIAIANTNVAVVSSTSVEFSQQILCDQIAAPSTPAGGKFTIYMDSGDGKLKAKSPNGTVTTLAAI